MAMTIKESVSTTVTEYNTVTSGVWTMDFKKTARGSDTTIVCYPKKSGAPSGFISYDVEKKTFLFQLNDQAKSDLPNLLAMFGKVCESIRDI